MTLSKGAPNHYTITHPSNSAKKFYLNRDFLYYANCDHFLLGFRFFSFYTWIKSTRIMHAEKSNPHRNKPHYTTDALKISVFSMISNDSHRIQWNLSAHTQRVNRIKGFKFWNIRNSNDLLHIIENIKKRNIWSVGCKLTHVLQLIFNCTHY